MLGNVAPVVLRPVPPPADLLARPDTPRRSLHVGVLVTDPVDRPGRGALLLDGLRLGLDAARDLDAVITARGSAPFGPALLDAAAGLLEGGADFLVVTSTGVAGLVGPLCATRGVGLVVADEGDRVEHPVEHQPGVLRRTERSWQEAYVLGQWSGRHLDGGLFQLVTHEEEAGDGVLALRAGFIEAGGHVAGSVEVWPQSASAGALVARVSGARVIAVHATGHQLHEIVGALARGSRPRRHRGGRPWRGRADAGRPRATRSGVRRLGLAPHGRPRPRRHPRTRHESAGRRGHLSRLRRGRSARRRRASRPGPVRPRPGRRVGRASGRLRTFHGRSPTRHSRRRPRPGRRRARPLRRPALARLTGLGARSHCGPPRGLASRP